MSFELVSFEDIANRIGLKRFTLEEYPALKVIKPSVMAAIEVFTGREFESKERTENYYIDLNGSRMVSLKAIPIASVASVTITYNDGTTDSLDSDDYRITPFGLRLITKFTDVDVTVVYTGGYTVNPDTRPGGLVRAAMLQCAYEFQTKDKVGASVVSSEGGTVTYPQIQLLKEVLSILKEFVHPLKDSIA